MPPEEEAMTDLYPATPRTARRIDREPWVDIEGAAEHLGVTARWLYAEGDRAGVPCARIGRSRRYQLSQLDDFMHSKGGRAA